MVGFGYCWAVFYGNVLQYLNEALEASGVPLEIVDGYIGSITVTIPWSALISDNTIIDISDLELTIKPKYREDNGGDASFYLQRFFVIIQLMCVKTA